MEGSNLSLPIYLVIMAGGSGTRFWPKSRKTKPKQFLSFIPGQPTLIELTLDRFQNFSAIQETLVVTTELLAEQAKDLLGNRAKILAEPEGRNTAPCIYWAAQHISKMDEDAIMMVMPSDHYIHDEESFRKSVEIGIRHASESSDLVTLGIRPTGPETGYGYLEIGSEIASGCQKVEKFVEKPNLEKAKKYLSSGKYLWNAGMFIWRVSVFKKEMAQILPEMDQVWKESGGNVQNAYPKLPKISIDYGLMEKSKNVATVPMDCGWDDLGSWTSLVTMADRFNLNSETGVTSAGTDPWNRFL